MRIKYMIYDPPRYFYHITTPMGFHERMQVIELNAFALIKWFKFKKERIVQWGSQCYLHTVYYKT